MDLSHETYAHPSSIGQHEIVEAPIKTTLDETSVTMTRRMYNIDPLPFWAADLKSREKRARWQICHFSLSANVMIDVGVALAGTGAPQGDRSKGVAGIVLNLMTPETETSAWYHCGMARNFQTDGRGLTGRIRDGQAAVFAEDMEIIEAAAKHPSASRLGIHQSEDREFFAVSSCLGVPSNMTLPPFVPPSGPMSMIQSARDDTVFGGHVDESVSVRRPWKRLV